MPIIEEAQLRGHYIVTCDYLPSNPGHKLADEYHNVSTTDIPAVITLAQKIRPEYIMAYASDVATMTAAIVSEKLRLPANSVDSVRILTDKYAFRSFLRDNGFETPRFMLGTKDKDTILPGMWNNFPCIVKPTDSTGSKGVMKVKSQDDMQAAIDHAREFSRSGNVIIEEFIDNEIAELHGDGFVEDGELIFSCLGDHIFSKSVNTFTPMGTIWPSLAKGEYLDDIECQVRSIIEKSGFMNGAINIEARVSSKGKTYVMEIGPRCGGNYVPQAVMHATGFNIVKAIMDNIEGCPTSEKSNKAMASAYYVIHAGKQGTLRDIVFKSGIDDYIAEKHIYFQPGQKVIPFYNSSAALGVVILKCDDVDLLRGIIRNIHEYIQVLVDK